MTDKAQIEWLAEQCEGDIGRDTAVDMAVAQLLYPFDGDMRRMAFSGSFSPTSSIDDAMKAIPMWWVLSSLTMSEKRTHWNAFCWPNDPHEDIRPDVPDGSARTAARAVTAAALRAQALAAGSRRAETGNTDSVRSKPERPAGQRPDTVTPSSQDTDQ